MREVDEWDTAVAIAQADPVDPVIFQRWVAGCPRPKGSLKVVSAAGKKPVLQEDNPRSKPWRERVASECGLVTNFGRGPGWPFTKAVEVELIFLFDRRGETPRPTREVGDWDKLVRNVLDALQDSGVLKNDAQVVGPFGHGGKYWTVDGADEQGVMITVRRAL